MLVDFLIIGQGVAGSCLAISLLRRGRSVMVVDRQDEGSSTRVAAGLITPLTGKGMNPAWEQERCLSFARTFYHRLEKETGRKFFHHQPVVRIFQDEKQKLKWENKKETCGAWAHDIEKLPEETPLKMPYGAIEMPEGAWLDTKVFLREVRTLLKNRSSWMEGDFSEVDVSFVDDRVVWGDFSAKNLILCQGAYGLGKDGWFCDMPHRSAKGEVLTLWVDGLDESKRYHGNGWLAPRGGGVWKAGANYDWDRLDSTPTEEGKEEILQKIKSWVKLPMEVIGHEAGVRPIIRNSQPVLGQHPEKKQIGFFNGLGSKGSMLAPAVADHFAEFLCGRCELDKALTIVPKHE